jgi:hypothetical protein
MDTLEMVSRLRRSDLDQATLDGLRIMADRLCSEYPFMPGDQLLVEGRSWLCRGAGPGVSVTAQPPKARTVPMTPEY